jgi:murein DD-endopeptidase MepM/ murein hydrolase activator NlpD
VVRATGDGKVLNAEWSGEYGLLIEIDHGRGIRTRYAHLSGVAERVRPGAEVEQGDPIGAVGSTGLSTAPHLHYEFLLNGRAVDPSAVALPVERPVPDADRERFARELGAANRLLARAPWPARAVASRDRPCARPRTAAAVGGC